MPGSIRRNADVPGKRNVDGFEAVWEQVSGRKLVYPEAQYTEPFLMKPEGYKWTPLAGAVGVEQKTLGVFMDCEIPCTLFKVEPKATFTAKGRGIFLVLSGRGALAGETFRTYTSLYLDTGETAQFKADEVSEILLMGMPDLADIQTFAPAERQLEAAH